MTLRVNSLPPAIRSLSGGQSGHSERTSGTLVALSTKWQRDFNHIGVRSFIPTGAPLLNDSWPLLFCSPFCKFCLHDVLFKFAMAFSASLLVRDKYLSRISG